MHPARFHMSADGWSVFRKAPHPPQIPGGLAAGGMEDLIGLNIDRDSSAPFEDGPL